MSTRALIKIKDVNNNHLVTLYNHWDGYPEGLGARLKEYIKSGTLVNGIPVMSDKSVVLWNGFGCFTASLIAALKDGPGNLYVCPKNHDNCWQEYVYTIKQLKNNKIRLTCYDVCNKKNILNFTEVF